MEGRLSFKAIFIGFIVDVFATSIIGGIIGGVAGGMMVASAMRGPGGAAAMNAATITQQTTAMMSSPLMIIATVASGVLGSVIGGYVTGVLAPRAELKNAAVVGALGLASGVLTIVAVPGMAAMTPLWVTYVSCALTVPAVLAGAALCAMRNAPAPHAENLDRFDR